MSRCEKPREKKHYEEEIKDLKMPKEIRITGETYHTKWKRRRYWEKRIQLKKQVCRNEGAGNEGK